MVSTPETPKPTKEQQDHEAFKNRLVEDVLGKDSGDKVPMEKVVMLIWQFRDDPSVVTFMARFVGKFAGSRDVFDGIEFYLPQLAHMIIHLEAEWDEAILERFALVIAQQSIHFALQLNWILQGALQDYQPELDERGEPNPTYNPLFYSRCLKLLKNLERCVVYGKPRAQELQRLYEKGKITKQELIILEQADRRFTALQITADGADDHHAALTLDGWMGVQMPVIPKREEGAPPPKPVDTDGEYVQRFCVLERNVLTCYAVKGYCKAEAALEVDRAMSLDGAQISSPTEFIIRIQTPKYSFRMRFQSKEEHALWHRRLNEEADASLLFQLHGKDSLMLQNDLTPAQRDRYHFFQNERDFTFALTKVAEDLRMVERDERKKLAPGKVAEIAIPETVYLPLCNSSDIWRRVSSALPDETKVFNTKARCPMIMHFFSRRGEHHKRGPKIDPNVDVAEYMHSYFDLACELEGVQEVAEEDEDAKEEDGDGKTEKTNGISSIDEGLNKGSDHSGVRPSIWREELADEGAEAGHHDSKKGNKKVQQLLRESFVVLPNKLSKRLPKLETRKRLSVMDRQTQLQPLVPILEGSRADLEADNASVGDGTVVSVEKSSILVKDVILYGDLQEGDIDLESIHRAKQFVSGGESWAEKSARMLEAGRKSLAIDDDDVKLEIVSCLAKSNDDLRQEVFIMQMIHYYKSVFAQAKLPLWLKTYRILSTSSNTGLLEFLTDATSLDGLKKTDGYPKEGGLRKYFELVYGGPQTKAFKAAQKNFMQSLAAYALVSYLLGLKDRHNGNIMIDTRGHLIFIDFGFAMGMAPGHEFSFERAPFKLTKEYVEVMDGVGSPCYKEFERLFVAGFEEARKNSQIALGLVEIMMFKSNYPCFSGWRYGNGVALARFEKRLMLKVPENQIKRRALKLIRKSKQHFGTYLYDAFQKATNGYEI